SWVVRTTEEFQIAIMTVTLQVWILLTKAVTAPDTARESETRRWIKYLQQKRAYADYQLKPRWLEVARTRMAEDISVRRLMVEILIEVGKMSGSKGRIVEIIADIGNYIAETGMAGFHLTIKYGIETRYPALALNEFQSDLTTILQLMKLYQEQGDRAPYLVILEDAVQTKFSPGNYPLLWSYAMGVGTAIDKSMGHLNYHRPYFEAAFFKLGQDVVNHLEGSVDTKIAAELGLSETQISDLKTLTKGVTSERGSKVQHSRTSRFAPERVDMEQSSEYFEDEMADQGRENPATVRLLEIGEDKAKELDDEPLIPIPRRIIHTSGDRDDKMRMFKEGIQRFKERAASIITKADIHPAPPRSSGYDDETISDVDVVYS
ncbi:nucleocapsid protein, partial [Bat paramyxovirus]|uniref:nucleocapsid protein n=1 Tax=Bat paramyxovirus TaxID=1300978 RepID=UPI0005FCB5D3